MPLVQPLALLKESVIDWRLLSIMKVSPSAPKLTFPLTDDPVRESSSDPEPVVIEDVIAVPDALRRSLPSRRLLSLPKEIVFPCPPIVASVSVRVSAPAPVLMLPVITDLELLLAPVTVRVSAPSLESVLEPRVMSPVIVEVLTTLAVSAPLPVVTLPVMLEASRLRLSVWLTMEEMIEKLSMA